MLSDRFAGAQAINLRQQPIPWAYRVFYRHIGLDPDEQLTPVEALALERMKKGAFRSSNLLDDALTIAIDRVRGRAARLRRRPGQRAAGDPASARPARRSRAAPASCRTGTLVIADEERPLALLFGALAAGRGVRPKTRRTTLVAIQVEGVPEIAVEEALWLAAGVMRG